MAGCAGPSKARYAQLLHECRDLNREHVRMLKEYDSAKCDARPTETYGGAEFGLGGLK